MTDDLCKRLREHVQSRGGLGKDDDGNIVLPNGAWAMMLKAASTIEAQARERDDLLKVILEDGETINALVDRAETAERQLRDAVEERDLRGHVIAKLNYRIAKALASLSPEESGS